MEHYQIKKETMQRFSDVTERLYGLFQASPLWPLIKDEPIIKEFISVLGEIKIQCEPQLCSLCMEPIHEGACNAPKF